MQATSQRRSRKKLLILMCFAVLPVVQAAGSDEPAYDRLVETLKQDWFSVGLLLQVVGDFQHDRSLSGKDGFSIANARLNVSGELDRGFGYFLQGNFADSPTLLDGKMYFKINRTLTVDAGLFKSPFSAEFLIPASGIDFVNRSRMVAALAPGREIGAQIRGDGSGGHLHYSLGMFNGNRSTNGNDNNHFLYAGRVAVDGSLANSGGPDSALEVGLNLAASKDQGASFLGGAIGAFNGRRSLAGIDARFTRGKWMVSGEAIWSELDPDTGTTVRPSGFQATAGRRVGHKSQVLLRWDHFSTDGIVIDTDLVILGYNLWPTKVSEIQLNYVIPERGGFDSHQLLANAQIGF